MEQIFVRMICRLTANGSCFFHPMLCFPACPSTVWSFVVKFWIPESRLNMVASSSAVKYMDVLAPSLSTVVHLGNLNLNFKESIWVYL